jgi:hypothetical protein
MKALLSHAYDFQSSGSRVCSFDVGIYDGTDVLGYSQIDLNVTEAQTREDIIDDLKARAVVAAANLSLTLDPADIIVLL